MKMDLMNFLSKYHITGDICIGAVVLAGQFDNHLWRLLVIAFTRGVFYHILPLLRSNGLVNFVVPPMPWWAFLMLSYVIMKVPHMRRRQKKSGCVFITGADSGMGQATIVHLLKTNGGGGRRNERKDRGRASHGDGRYDLIFAGAYDAKSAEEKLLKLCVKENADPTGVLRVVPLDVTSDESVAKAAETVEKAMVGKKSVGLTGLINFHGVAFSGPIEYMPMAMYRRQHEVNYMGNIRMTQRFLPLIKKACQGQGKGTDLRTRGRIVFTGTGGGPCSPCPPLLSAYMCSKFACEALAQSLRMELFMTDQPIDCSVINPGFVKPTMLMEEGNKLTEKMWKACEDEMGNTRAKEEFGPMMNHFVRYSSLVPGTHVSEVCNAAEDALTANRPRSSYKVGIDSKLAPIVGMMPTGARELISRHGMYGMLSPAGTVKGYKV